MIKKSNTEKIILGIDPGTNVMGYGVIRIIGNKAELVVMGVIDMRKESDPYLRLGKIFDRVTGIIDSYLPDRDASASDRAATRSDGVGSIRTSVAPPPIRANTRSIIDIGAATIAGKRSPASASIRSTMPVTRARSTTNEKPSSAATGCHPCSRAYAK